VEQHGKVVEEDELCKDRKKKRVKEIELMLPEESKGEEELTTKTLAVRWFWKADSSRWFSEGNITRVHWLSSHIIAGLVTISPSFPSDYTFTTDTST